MVKATCCKTLIIVPINPRRNDEPIWLICDALKFGVGAMYSQGTTWQKCHPSEFMSKKFTIVQHNYAIHELETLAILEALMKWEATLIGYQVHVITNHKALEFFKTQAHLLSHQHQWMDYISKFDFDITYVKGELNKVVDGLSRYFESDIHVDVHDIHVDVHDIHADVHDIHNYVQADTHIDPDGEDLPVKKYHEVRDNVVESCTLQEIKHRRSKCLQEC